MTHIPAVPFFPTTKRNRVAGPICFPCFLNVQMLPCLKSSSSVCLRILAHLQKSENVGWAPVCWSRSLLIEKQCPSPITISPVFPLLIYMRAFWNHTWKYGPTLGSEDWDQSWGYLGYPMWDKGWVHCQPYKALYPILSLQSKSPLALCISVEHGLPRTGYPVSETCYRQDTCVGCTLRWIRLT